jgi:hypothetical protein
VRFRLRLSEKGRRLGARERRVFADADFEIDAESVSSDPLRMERVFHKVGKPLPAEFIRMFTIDTLLGRWMPLPVSELVDTRLAGELAPYVRQVQRLTTDTALGSACAQQEERVKRLRRRGLVEGADGVVPKWRESAGELFDESRLADRKPGRTYANLTEVTDGRAAQRAYCEAIDPATPRSRRRVIESRLTRYCATDSIGMLSIARHLTLR